MFTFTDIINYFLVLFNVKKVKALCDGCNKCEYNNIDNWKSYTFPCIFSVYNKMYIFNEKMMNPQLCPNCCNNKMINADIKLLQYVTNDKCVSFENCINFNVIYSSIIFLMRHPKYKPKNVFVTTYYIIKLFNNNISQEDIKLLTDMTYIKEVSYENVKLLSNIKSIENELYKNNKISTIKYIN